MEARVIPFRAEGPIWDEVLPMKEAKAHIEALETENARLRAEIEALKGADQRVKDLETDCENLRCDVRGLRLRVERVKAEKAAAEMARNRYAYRTRRLQNAFRRAQKRANENESSREGLIWACCIMVLMLGTILLLGSQIWLHWFISVH